MGKQPEGKLSTRIMKYLPVEELSKVLMARWREKGKFREVDNGCWLWQGKPGPRGYQTAKGKGVHQWAYISANGPVPEGQVIDHLCHDPKFCPGGVTCKHRLCINPSHLESTEQSKNTKFGRGNHRNGRKAHCPKGHPYDEANTRLVKRTTAIGNEYVARYCRKCGN